MPHRVWLFMPYMHSESPEDQQVPFPICMPVLTCEKVLGSANLSVHPTELVSRVLDVTATWRTLTQKTFRRQDCIRLFEELELECQRLPGGGEPLASRITDNVKYAKAHEAVVRKWGRFPHRNGVLGRESTPEEAAGLLAGSIPKF